MAMQFRRGQVIQFATTFQDIDSNPIDVDSPKVAITSPVLVVTEVAMTRLQVGDYIAEWTVPQDADVSDLWQFKFTGLVGLTPTESETQLFEILDFAGAAQAANVARRITAVFDHLDLTLDEVKRYLRVPLDFLDDDPDIQGALDAAKCDADNYCQNNFGFSGYGVTRYIPKTRDDIQRLTGLFTYYSGDILSGLTVSQLPSEVSPLATIPPAVKQWVKQRVTRYYTRRVEGMTFEAVGGVGSVSYGALDYSALSPYRRWRGL